MLFADCLELRFCEARIRNRGRIGPRSTTWTVSRVRGQEERTQDAAAADKNEDLARNPTAKEMRKPFRLVRGR